MQRAAAKKAGELITISDAARQIGVNKSTLARQIKTGAIRSHAGKVRLAEVLEDRARNIDLSQSRRKPKAPTAAVASAPGATPAATPGEPDPGDDIVLVDGQALAFADAQRLKETYLARLRKLEFEKKRGTLIDKELATKVFFDTAREARDAWLGWPGRVAVPMAAELDIDSGRLAEVLTRHVHQHLSELGEPNADFGGG